MTADPRRAADPEALVAAALAMAARGKRALADDDLAALAPLLPALARLGAELAATTSADPALPPGRLLALIDEIGGLARELRAARTQLAGRLKDGDAQRRAGRAYRQASRL